MPKALEDKLRREGRAKGLTGKRLEAYVYGTLTRIAIREKPKKAVRRKG